MFVCRCDSFATDQRDRRHERSQGGRSVRGHVSRTILRRARPTCNCQSRTVVPHAPPIYWSACSRRSVGAPIGDRWKQMGVCSSIGSVVDACDNAVAERIFARLECEFIAGHSWKTKTEARRALFTWIETTLCGAVSDCDNIKSIEKTGGEISSVRSLRRPVRKTDMNLTSKKCRALNSRAKDCSVNLANSI